MKMSRLYGAASAATLFFALGSARAQDPSGAAPAAPPPSAPVAADARAPSTAPPAAAQPTTLQPAAPGAPEEPEEKGRLRIGFNFLNGGLGSGGGLSGPTFGATFKIGWQLSRLMGVYGNISPFVWVGSSDAAAANGGKLTVGAIAGTQFTPLFSLSPADIFEVAAGPSFDYLGGGSVGGGSGTASASAFGGFYFALHGKLALHLGGRKPETGRRKGFTIEANIHPTFTPGSAVTFFTLGLGYDWL